MKSKRVLEKNIPDLTIRKNSNYSLNLSEYFLNVENYEFFQQENISIDFDGEIALIKPKENWTGTALGKISAIRKKQKIESSFNIIVSEKNLSIITLQGRAKLGQKVKW